MIEGNTDESDNFDMEIIGEDSLDKALTVPEKTLDRQNPGRTFMMSWTMDVSNNQMLSFRNSFY